MARKANTSVWIEEADKVGLDLNFLRQDKEGMFEKLDSLGLPRPATYIIPTSQIDSPRTRKILERTNCFCRLIPKHGGRRPYKPNIASIKGLKWFCKPHDLSQYEIQLVEKGNITHTGSIIAEDESIGIPGKSIMEIVEGTGEDLFHGLKTPNLATIDFPGINWFRAIRYDSNQDPTQEERKIIWQAVKMIGGPKHPFPGYYEFNVYDRTRIVFRNYQPPSSAYAKLS